MTSASRRPASSSRRPRSPARARLEEARLGWLLALPVAAVIAVLVFYPLILGFGLSLRSVHFGSGTPETFVGLKNYSDVLTRPESRSALINTFGYVSVAVVLEIIFGTLMALVLNRGFRGRSVLFAVLILPWALPGIVSGLLWTRILNPDNGLLNSALFQLHLIDQYQVWFSSPLASIVLIAIVHVRAAVHPRRAPGGGCRRRRGSGGPVPVHYVAPDPTGHGGGADHRDGRSARDLR